VAEDEIQSQRAEAQRKEGPSGGSSAGKGHSPSQKGHRAKAATLGSDKGSQGPAAQEQEGDYCFHSKIWSYKFHKRT